MTEMHFPNPSARLEIRVLGNGFHYCSYYSDEVIFAFVMAFTTLYVACALGDYSLSIMITKVRTVSWPISYFSSPPKKWKQHFWVNFTRVFHRLEGHNKKGVILEPFLGCAVLHWRSFPDVDEGLTHSLGGAGRGHDYLIFMIDLYVQVHIAIQSFLSPPNNQL